MDIGPILRLAERPERIADSSLAEALELSFEAHDAIAASAAPTPADLDQLDELAHAASAFQRETDRRRGPEHVAERIAASRAKMGGVRRSVTASGSRSNAAGMARTRGRARPSPGSSPARRGVTLVAAAGGATVLAGTPLTDRLQLGELMGEVLETMRNTPTPNRSQRTVVAAARWADAYPEDRRLGRDPIANGERIAVVCAPEAVTASGGTCLPVNVDYSVPTWAGATRPLRGGLPSFQADRGGLRFVTPPDVGVVSLQSTPASGLGSATSVWSEATDANPGATTKPVYVVQCGTEQLVYVNAIPTRLQFGNMQGRFAPEQIASNTDVAVAAAAREAELELLTLMYGASKQIKAPATAYLGACRDILSAADVLAAKYRYSHRIPETTRLTAVFPEWARAMMRSDLARELVHDNTSGRDVMAMADDVIDEWFAVRGINVIWTMDGLKAGTYGTGGSALKSQFFAVAGTSATTVAWPNVTAGAVQVGWLLYAEGSYQFLDGGRLTLGVVRDSTLDATNDYETFVEVFEGIAFRGIEAYQVQSTVKPNGGSAGTIAVTSYDE